MFKMNIRKSLLAKIVLGLLVTVIFTESAWAILGVWRRAAFRTAVVAGTVATADAVAIDSADANAVASANAAAAASAQQSAAASAAAAQKAAASAQAAAPQKTPQQQLEDLKSLYDQGLISESDYEAAKTKVLNEITQ